MQTPATVQWYASIVTEPFIFACTELPGRVDKAYRNTIQRSGLTRTFSEVAHRVNLHALPPH